MTERPIIFSAPMVRAILAGRKTQTRRIVKGVEECAHGYDAVTGWADGREARIKLAGGATLQCPYGALGDRLWVRESFHLGTQNEGRKPSLVRAGSSVWYEADRERGLAQPGKLWPSIFMPRWACRLVLALTTVRVERLQDISEKDAKAEGIALPTNGSHVGGYAILWDSLNAKRAPWSTNPWVWVVEFKRGTA